LPLQAIAELTAYDSVSHLSRHVKAATGSAPGALRDEPPRRSASRSGRNRP